MIDKDILIKGAEEILSYVLPDEKDTSGIMVKVGWVRDVLALLKEQEAVEPTFRQGEDGVFVWACGSCGAYMYHIYDGIDKAKEYAKYCRQCGKKVKWE